MRALRTFSLSMVLFGAGMLAVHGQEAAPSQALTLQSAVALALKQNPTVQAAEAYAEAIQQGIVAARAEYLPRLDLSEGFTRGNNPVYVLVVCLRSINLRRGISSWFF